MERYHHVRAAGLEDELKLLQCNRQPRAPNAQHGGEKFVHFRQPPGGQASLCGAKVRSVSW
jgi:hypothetical protein